jgi:DNA replication protein DnaC
MVEFEEFWANYPRRVGKLKALRLWNKFGAMEKELVMRGLHLWKQAASWHQGDGQFIPYASTFLAQKRYLDEPWTNAFKEQRGCL